MKTTFLNAPDQRVLSSHHEQCFEKYILIPNFVILIFFFKKGIKLSYCTRKYFFKIEQFHESIHVHFILLE